MSDDDELVIGAEEIAKEIFGGRLNPRQIYRLLENEPEPWGAFKILNKWCGRRGRMRAELARREAPLNPHPPQRRPA